MNYTIFGESHGPAIGVVLQDVPSGIRVDEDEIALQLRRRSTGRNALSTARKETDQVEILSGVFEGRTTGTPMAMLIRNTDQHSGDYAAIRALARPGHADLPGYVRYGGFNDYRGGGHFSGRLTAALVAGGTVARMYLMEKGIRIGAHIASIGGVRDAETDAAVPDMDALEACALETFPVLNREQGEAMQNLILTCRAAEDSVGGEITCYVTGVPMGLGEPDTDRNAETMIARQMLAIPAVKALAFGDGFGLSGMRGSEANDVWYMDGNVPRTRTNRNGGILGGITTGMPLVIRVGIKPTPSIGITQETVNFLQGCDQEITIRGRHDPCIVHRAVPVVEAAAALAVMDLMQGRNGRE